MTLPLLIGGATTSPQHTAVKIAPEYSQPTVHVLDASRVVDVVASLISPEQKPAFDRRQPRAPGEAARAARRAARAADAVDREGAREPAEAGLHRPRRRRRRRSPALEEGGRRAGGPGAVHRLAVLLRGLGAEGPLPRHPRATRASARPRANSTTHAQKLLKQIVDGKLIRARGVYGFWPANADGDDIVLYREPGTGSRQELVRFPMLRQQEVIADDKPNRSLADFIAPVESGVADYLGAFAVTAGLGVDELVKKFEAQHDDYSAIIVKALADRLAEAFAEYLHAQARRDWGIVDRLSQRRPDRREVPGHPAGVRLSGLSRSQREGAAVRPARRARRWASTSPSRSR